MNQKSHRKQYRSRPYREPVPLADALRPLMRGIRPAKRAGVERVKEVWPAVVGAAAAKRTRVAACKDGELLIEVSSAALRQHLSVFQREEILRGLRERLPELSIESLKCRVSGGF